MGTYDLPVECRQAILCHLLDLQALKAAILSHSAMYSAITSGQGPPILHGITLGLIFPELLPDAVFALNSSRFEVEPWTEGAFDTRGTSITASPILFPMDPPRSFKLQGFYQHVRFFTFALSAKPALPAHSPSRAEWCRVARSFYRVEVYTHLFMRRDAPRSK